MRVWMFEFMAQGGLGLSRWLRLTRSSFGLLHRLSLWTHALVSLRLESYASLIPLREDSVLRLEC